MVGVIKSWDILAHPITTIHCFGWLVFFKAAVPWRDTSFLSLIRDAGFLGPSGSSATAILDRCIDLELRAKRIYATLANKLDDQGLVGTFFAGLVEQEQYHADLLEVARAVAARKGWKAKLFNPWEDYLPRLENQMTDMEAAASRVNSVDEALRMVVQIESAEINQVFHFALAATDAAFVKRLKPFQQAMEAHMTYLVERIPELSPRLLLSARELRAKFPQVQAELR